MLGGSLEENVLCALVHHDTLAPHIAISLTPGDFSVTVYRRIATVAIEFLQHYREPAKAHIGDLLEHEIRRGPDGRFFADVLQQMERLAPSLNEGYVRGTLDRFIATNRMLNAVNSAADLLHEGDLDAAREVLRAPSLLLRPDQPGVWLADSDHWLSFLREDEDVELFSSGIEILDDKDVRPARGELFAFLAASGRGKSWFLINVGKHNAIGRRKKVLHITLENSLKVTVQRYTQCLLVLTRNETLTLDTHIFMDRDDPDQAHRARYESREFRSIRSTSLSELHGRLKPFQARGELLIKHFPTGTLTIGMLNSFLDALEQADGFKPDLVLLDYLTLMHLDSSRDGNIRVAIGQLARQLRGMAETRGFALVTALQANRLAAGKQWVYGSNVAEDWSVHGTCDTFVTYSQTDHEREQGFARILVDKCRNSSDKWKAFVEQQYAIGQFCTDSVYMGKHIAEQLGEAEAS